MNDYEQLGYDAGGNVTTRRLRDGQSIAFNYDKLGRLILKDLPGSEPDVSYGYDLLGRMTSASQTNNALSFGWDALGRNTSQGGPQGTLNYGYDAASRRTSMAYPAIAGASALTVNYDHDVTGNLTAVRENNATSGSGVLAAYAYDNLGRRQSLTYGNGVVQSYSYDASQRLGAIASNLGGTAQDVTASFAYNPASQLDKVSKNNDAYAWTGHWNKDIVSAANGLNQLTAATPGSGQTSVPTLTHDSKGNTTGIGASSYSYSSQNQLVSGPNSTGLTYDPAMRLYKIGNSSVTTKFQYDGSDLIAEYSNGNTLLRRYVHGPGADEPLVQYEGTTLSNKRYLTSDERGSVIAVTDSSGNSIATNRYDEYGNPASTNASIANGGRFGFTGQTWLPELNLWHYNARIYNPSLGRFMQTDPIGYGDGMNWYGYVGSDPVNFVDPTGLDGCPTNDDDGCGIVVVGPRTTTQSFCFDNPMHELCGSGLPGSGRGDGLGDGLEEYDGPAILVNGLGHQFDTDNLICDSTTQTCNISLFNSEVCVLPGWLSRGRVRSGNRYLVGAFVPVVINGRLGEVFVPGGYVTSTNVGSNMWVNATTPLHAFQGTISRAFYQSGTQWRVATYGVGFAGPDAGGAARDAINQIFGPEIFNNQDRKCSAAVTGG